MQTIENERIEIAHDQTAGFENERHTHKAFLILQKQSNKAIAKVGKPDTATTK